MMGFVSCMHQHKLAHFKEMIDYCNNEGEKDFKRMTELREKNKRTNKNKRMIFFDTKKNI